MNNVFKKYTTIGVRALLVVMATGLLYTFLYFGGVSTEADSGAVTIYAYSDMLSQDDFVLFTQKTGIKVIVRHFETIEEVMTKLVFTGDNAIDLIAPTDAMVEVLIKKGLLKKLDYSRLPAADELDSRLLKAFYDPENKYSLPFEWTPIGIGYDTRVLPFDPEDIDWDVIFGRVCGGKLQSPEYLYGPAMNRVCLGDDPIETIFLAMVHLYGRTLSSLSPLQERQLVAVLRRQKEWVECYSNNLRHFLVSGVCPAVVIPAAYMVKTVRKHAWTNFAIPSRGTVMFVGNLVLLKKSKRSAQAHEVINYLLSEEGASICYKNHVFIPANRKAYQAIPEEDRNHKFLFPDDELFDRISMLNNAIPLKKLEYMWQQAIV